MHFKIHIENIEEFGMGGPYAGTCYAINNKDKKFFITSMAMENFKKIAENIFFIPVLHSEVNTQNAGYVLERTIQVGIANMNTMKFSILKKSYPFVIDINFIKDNKLKIFYKDWYGKQFEDEVNFSENEFLSIKDIENKLNE